MGGFGSGRIGGGRPTTNTMRALDVRELHRRRLLETRHAFSWQWIRDGDVVGSIQLRADAEFLNVSYRTREYGGPWQPVEGAVRLAWSECHFGGRRPWLLCPRCGLRVAIVYCGADVACRRCYGLAYKCQWETRLDRALRRAHGVRDRLGWPGGIASPTGGKPKGMHWRTFLRLRVKHDLFADRACSQMAAMLGLK